MPTSDSGVTKKPPVARLTH